MPTITCPAGNAACASARPERRFTNQCCHVGRRRGVLMVLNSAADEANPDSTPRRKRLPLLTRLSAVVEHQAAVQKFENLAGRSAMLGFMTTVGIEIMGGGHTPVVGMNPEQGQLFLAILLLVVTSAAIIATQRKRVLGGLLLEAVMASLTSSTRSASSLTSITPSSLDATIDVILDKVFDQNMTSFCEWSISEAESSDDQA